MPARDCDAGEDRSGAGEGVDVLVEPDDEWERGEEDISRSELGGVGGSSSEMGGARLRMPPGRCVAPMVDGVPALRSAARVTFLAALDELWEVAAETEVPLPWPVECALRFMPLDVLLDVFFFLEALTVAPEEAEPFVEEEISDVPRSEARLELPETSVGSTVAFEGVTEEGWT